MRLGDILIVGVIVVFATFGIVSEIGRVRDRSRIVIQTNTKTYVYPSNVPRTVRVWGRRGVSIIVITNGTARFIESECPNKLCIAMGDLNAVPLYCLPNGVSVAYEGADESKYDTVVE